ncbi:hypothetical protein E1301_Tti010026 [Triplophysa tibetana]|uniref:Uncharacterized protein n=1 Tax=Triplophysa tibetana TaxID=1572043 RepID=A0A5A9NW81_9TELE|nr:hypothetical protein E1301_Tti010026 [Triplophysa tibetana]
MFLQLKALVCTWDVFGYPARGDADADIEYYYDTESFRLASTQTWLNQHVSQWELIMAQKQNITSSLSEETKNSDEQKRNTADSSSQEREQPGSHPEKRNTADSENLTSKCEVQSTSSDDISAGSAYTELNDPCSIMMHITKCLQLPLTHAEVQEMTMKNFFWMAKIQIYDSWMGSRFNSPVNVNTVASSPALKMHAPVLFLCTEARPKGHNSRFRWIQSHPMTISVNFRFHPTVQTARCYRMVETRVICQQLGISIRKCWCATPLTYRNIDQLRSVKKNPETAINMTNQSLIRLILLLA